MNEDDIRENIVPYDDEAGEAQCTDTQIAYQTVPRKNSVPNGVDPRLCATLNNKLTRATSDDNFMGAPWDSRLLYKYEGSNSVLNSLSSLNTNYTDRSLDLQVITNENNGNQKINFCAYKTQ